MTWNFGYGEEDFDISFPQNAMTKANPSIIPKDTLHPSHRIAKLKVSPKSSNSLHHFDPLFGF